MPSLSFEDKKDSIPLAIVKGGDYNKEILFLHTDDNVKQNKKVDMGISQNKYEKELKALKLKPNQKVMLINKLQEAKSKNIPSNQLI